MEFSELPQADKVRLVRGGKKIFNVRTHISETIVRYIEKYQIIVSLEWRPGHTYSSGIVNVCDTRIIPPITLLAKADIEFLSDILPVMPKCLPAGFISKELCRHPETWADKGTLS